MNRLTKWLCFVLILCLMSSLLPTALADQGAAEEADVPVAAEVIAPAKETAEQTEPAGTAAELPEPAETAAEMPEPADEVREAEAETPGQAAEEVTEAEKPAQWTVMIYLCGTDLESMNGMATTNLEMIAGTVPVDGVNVLIQTGGTKSWQAEDVIGIDIAVDRLQRWSWDENGFTLVDEQELASMAKHTTLSDFIRWSAENYPAEHYMLDLWDHGGGSVSGLIVDELHEDAMMSLEGLQRALKNGGVHFSLVMMDACLMACLETAQAVAPYADYLVASEEALPGLGSNYEEWLQCLYDEPGCGPVRLGKNVCNATQIMYAEGDDESSNKGLTFSLIDLSKTDSVADAFNDYMQEVVGLISDPAAFGDYLFAVSTTDRYMFPEMWDLYDMARRGMKGGISKETALKLENAVDDAVVYSVRQAYHPYSHGLSVYLRYSDDGRGWLNRLARCCSNPWQLAFLDAVNLNWDAPEWVCDIVGEIPQLRPELYTVDFDTETAEDQSRAILNIYSGIDSGGYIRYELQRYNEQDQCWYTLGENEDVDLIDAADEKTSFAAHFTGRWPAIEGEFLSISSKDIVGNKVLLQAPVRVFGEESKLRILAEYPEDMTFQMPDGAAQDDEAAEDTENEYAVTYELEGVWDGYDSSTGLVDRNTWSLASLVGLDFDVCRPVYSDYLDQVGDMKYSDPLVFDLNLAIEDSVLPEGQYRLRYTISDMLDRTYHSDFFYLTWDGTQAVFEDLDPVSAEEAGEAA